MSKAKGKSSVLRCRVCEKPDTLAQRMVVTGYAPVARVRHGEILLGSTTNMDWDSVRPADDPPVYVCTHCSAQFTAKGLGVE